MKNAVLIAALVLGACSNTHVYVKSGSDVHASDADMSSCRTAMSPYSGNEAKATFDKCMADKGYEKKIDKYHL